VVANKLNKKLVESAPKLHKEENGENALKGRSTRIEKKTKDWD
jgi:hypothetical protein